MTPRKKVSKKAVKKEVKKVAEKVIPKEYVEVHVFDSIMSNYIRQNDKIIDRSNHNFNLIKKDIKKLNTITTILSVITGVCVAVLGGLLWL